LKEVNLGYEEKSCEEKEEGYQEKEISSRLNAAAFKPG
jgi:hypothetical protein